MAKARDPKSSALDVSKLVAEMSRTRVRGRSRRSRLYLWFRENHDRLEAEFARNSPMGTARRPPEPVRARSGIGSAARSQKLPDKPGERAITRLACPLWSLPHRLNNRRTVQ
jgi:hypothetical protein